MALKKVQKGKDSINQFTQKESWHCNIIIRQNRNESNSTQKQKRSSYESHSKAHSQNDITSNYVW